MIELAKTNAKLTNAIPTYMHKLTPTHTCIHSVSIEKSDLNLLGDSNFKRIAKMVPGGD